MFLAMLLQLSGIDVLLFYMEELLAKVGTNITPADGTIIMGVVQVSKWISTGFLGGSDPAVRKFEDIFRALYFM